MPHRTRRLGFTLVELLVVIGIIAILIAILLPTLAGARRSAATVKCAAQLRDIGSAIQIYATENTGHVPAVQAIYSSKWRPMWYDHLAKYVFKSAVAIETPGKPGTPLSVINVHPSFGRTPFAGCPAFEYDYYFPNPTRSATGYGINLIPLAPAMTSVSGGDQKFVTNTYPNSSSAPARYFKFSEFKNPCNRALMADSNGYNGIRAMDPDPVQAYIKPPGNNNAGDIDYYRHGKMFDLVKPGVNVMFADFHVETCTAWQAFWAIRDPIKRANGAR